MRLVRAEDGAEVAGAVEVARGFLGRFLGLMGRRALPAGGALWLEPCDAVHMMFMRFPIDVVFVRRGRGEPLAPGAGGEVVGVRAGVRPWLGLARCPGATSAVELEAGRAAAVGVAPGQALRLEGAA